MPINKNNPERRAVTGEVEIRSLNGNRVIEGHAAVFNRISQNMGGFVEKIRPGAFTKTLQEADVRALINHDPNLVLGRNKSGTLNLAQDDIGLRYGIMPPNTTYANDLAVSMERGDIDRSSFGFFAVDEDWSMTEQGFPVRELIQVSLVDVSVVTYPAYLDAESFMRESALVSLEKRSGVPLKEMLSDPEQIKCAVGLCKIEKKEQKRNEVKLSDEEQKYLDQLLALEVELRK